MTLEEIKAHVDKFMDEATRQESKDLLLHVIESMDLQDVESVVQENVVDLEAD